MLNLKFKSELKPQILLENMSFSFSDKKNLRRLVFAYASLEGPLFRRIDCDIFDILIKLLANVIVQVSVRDHV